MKIKIKSLKEMTTVSGGSLGDVSLPQRALGGKPPIKLTTKKKKNGQPF